MITAEEAVRIVNEEMTYKPGWKLNATIEWPDMFFGESDRFTFEAVIETVNTSDPELKQEITIAPGGSVVIKPEWTRDDFVRAIFETVMRIELHESREFFRVGGRAPFHPHRVDGNQLYEDTERISPVLV